MIFGAPGRHFDGFIYIRYATPSYSARISAIYLFPFDTVWFCWLPCATPGNEAEHRIFRGCSKALVLFYPFMDHKFWDNVGDSSCFPAPLPACLYHVSFRRYSPLSVEVVEKPNECKVSWPHFFGGRPQLFYSRLLARFTIRRLTKFGWVPFADLRLRGLAMTQKAEFRGGYFQLQAAFNTPSGKPQRLWFTCD